MTASPWTPTTLGFARLVGTEPVAVLLAPADGGMWRTLYRDGGAWREGTKGDDVIAAAKAMNTRVRSLGIECDDEVPGWGGDRRVDGGGPRPLRRSPQGSGVRMRRRAHVNPPRARRLARVDARLRHLRCVLPRGWSALVPEVRDVAGPLGGRDRLGPATLVLQVWRGPAGVAAACADGEGGMLTDAFRLRRASAGYAADALGDRLVHVDGGGIAGFETLCGYCDTGTKWREVRRGPITCAGCLEIYVRVRAMPAVRGAP